MNRKKAKRIGVALLVTTAISVPAVYAYAKESSAKPAVADTATPGSSQSSLMKLSQDGSVALRDIEGARVALFNGDPTKAQGLVAEAKASLDAAKIAAPTFVVDRISGVNDKIVEDSVKVSKLNMVPVDAQLSLGEGFVPTPQKQAHLGKANEHFKAGHAKEALDELRLAEVEVNYTRALLPIDATQKRVADATSLLASKKFYEANLALKNAEDGVVVNTASLIDTVAKTPSAVATKAPKKT